MTKKFQCMNNGDEQREDDNCEEDNCCPDVQELFKQYDLQFFEGLLALKCSVEWSNKLTTCAGICYFKKRPNLSAVTKASKEGAVAELLEMYPKCIIRLSAPIHIYRSVTELKETLIHEMIHAYCFILDLEKSRDGHGAVFRDFMHKINAATGLNITVYHSFHQEVNHYKVHVWRCDGICRLLAPYFGYVRRAQNRPPGPSSWWWERHKLECGGTYHKMDGFSATTPNDENKPLKIITHLGTAKKTTLRSTSTTNSKPRLINTNLRQIIGVNRTLDENFNRVESNLIIVDSSDQSSSS